MTAPAHDREPTRAYLGVGSNLGDRSATIASSIATLGRERGVTVVAHSELIETTPIGPPGQDPYLNAVVSIDSTLAARPLLDACLRIEAEHGRDRRRERRWGPRPVDLDLLLFGTAVIAEPDLTVPHPRLHERLFVLEPLAALAPRAMHPVLGRTIESLRDRLQSRTPAAVTDADPSPPGRWSNA